MNRLLPAVLAVCLLLTGCGWLNGSYASVTPHQQHSGSSDSQVEVAENYLQLRTALEDMIVDGVKSRTISVAGFHQAQLPHSMDMAVRYVKNTHPIGAYAVGEITYEVGVLGGGTAVAVEIEYVHERNEIQRVRQVADMAQARDLISVALIDYSTSLVMLVGEYEAMDIHQLVDDFAAANPGQVMETPEVSVRTYPESGRKRVLELKFTYQSSRDNLRTMRDVVQRVFDSAALYVSHDAQDAQKLSQLYSFLMERFESYQVKTSITPSYSLLNHGVGDSAAFAEVYAEMCQRAGVECLVVVGTRSGEPWCWNIVLEDGYYYHVDLLACQARGGYAALTDSQMADYVWDYSAYPACSGKPVIEESAQTTAPEEETLPAGTEK